ncbi:MAG TPA: heterodisulfide reductase-related iron-sulfur binding cluster [Chloroflexota bacterium]|nr:heterodisulfide reductase-related iron-sulfur binding cluster [Chloroflexota bacterium]
MAVSKPERHERGAWNEERFEGLYRCVHCGLCLGACPTYRELGLESDSPRGRLYLMRALVEGRTDLNDDVVTHMERCLVCRACETACPSGVPFGHLMELTRETIQQEWPRPLAPSLARTVLLRHIFTRPERLRLLGRLSRWYQRSGAQRLARALGLIPASLRGVEALMPEVSPEFFEPPSGQWFYAHGQAVHRVGLLSGCVMSLCFADIDRATVRVLNRNGCDVFVPRAQTCCGALHAHDGDRATARQLARANIDAFGQERLDAVIMNAAGCGATVKEYAELLKDDPRYADSAQRFASSVRDVTEFLAALPLNTAFGRLEKTVTYQEPCHLAHGQRVRQQPRDLLRAIPGLRLVEMRDSDRCCGSAGIYNITQNELSRRFMAEKSAAAAATGAEMVVSANPGCMIQLAAGLRERGASTAVKHIVELLDEAYEAGEV